MSDRPVALITGGARGIGEGIVRELASDHSIAFTWLNSEKRANELMRSINNSLAIRANLVSSEAADDIVQQTLERFGCLDVVVNNASEAATSSIETGARDEYRRMFDINVLAPVAVIQSALPHLNAGSSIINLSSVNAQVPPAVAGAFAATKAALEAWTIAMAKELGPRGIRVNCVAPGVIRVDDIERAQEVLDKVTSLTPLGEIGHVSDVAAVVRFLATAGSRHITGECIRVAGGFGR